MLDKSAKDRLAWRCRRGMLELDLILQNFLKHIDQCNSGEIEAFNSLLSSTDPELLAWLMDQEDPQDEELLRIVKLIRNTLGTSNHTQ